MTVQHVGGSKHKECGPEVSAKRRTAIPRHSWLMDAAGAVAEKPAQDGPKRQKLREERLKKSVGENE